MTGDFKVKLKEESYKKGYAAGYGRMGSQPPVDVDTLSFSSGYIEGKADRQKGIESKYSAK